MPDTWGIVPAAGRGSRIQPLGFSKELLPVGSRIGAAGERPCAVSEYLVDRMRRGGAGKFCFVIGPGKSDIMEYFAGDYAGAPISYVVQPSPSGLCDAIFRAAPVIASDDHVLIGLPDTIWFPADAFCAMDDGELSFLLFPVERPELFDAVVLDGDAVVEIEVKSAAARSHWVWGAIKMPARVLDALHRLWRQRGCSDEYVGTLVNAYLAAGGRARGVKAGTDYADVGTLEGYRAALDLLARVSPPGNAAARAAGEAETRLAREDVTLSEAR